MDIKVGVSNHHVHLTEKDLYTLFGEGYKLTEKRKLLQLGQFAADETVDEPDEIVDCVNILRRNLPLWKNI